MPTSALAAERAGRNARPRSRRNSTRGWDRERRSTSRSHRRCRGFPLSTEKSAFTSGPASAVSVRRCASRAPSTSNKRTRSLRRNSERSSSRPDSPTSTRRPTVSTAEGSTKTSSPGFSSRGWSIPQAPPTGTSSALRTAARRSRLCSSSASALETSRKAWPIARVFAVCTPQNRHSYSRSTYRTVRRTPSTWTSEPRARATRNSFGRPKKTTASSI